MADDRDEQRRTPDNPFDAWLAEAPSVPPHPLCPWCSARLDPPDAETCPACGAHVRATDVDAIPGVTVVDPEVARRTRVVRQSGGTGLFTWLTGDRDLVDAALAQQPGPSAGPVPVPGTESRDAVAPPDAVLRREMRRVGREDDAGSAADGMADASDASAAGSAADGTGGTSGAPVAPDGPDAPRGDPAS